MQSRQEHILTAIRLEYFTVGYNIVEGLVGLFLGGIANSVALIGFGLDSFVETFSGLVVLRRFRAESRGECGDEAEAKALKYVGWSFVILATYVVVDAMRRLISAERPDPSVPGIALAVISLVVMPALASRKRRAGQRLASAALVSDSRQTLACSFLSAFLLLGLLLNAALGWWWADPVGALAMVPWLVQEAREALSGRACCN